MYKQNISQSKENNKTAYQIINNGGGEGICPEKEGFEGSDMGWREGEKERRVV